MKYLIVVLESDLRIRDNPVLVYAAEKAMPILIVCKPPLGSANKWWFYESCKSLQKDLNEYGIPLIVWEKEIGNLPVEAGEIVSNLPVEGVKCVGYPNLLHDSPAVNYKLCGAFWKHVLKTQSFTPPLSFPKFRKEHASALDIQNEYPIPTLSGAPWWRPFESIWEVGEKAAYKTFNEFLHSKILHYDVNRDHMGIAGTSRLSPHLRFGEMSIREIWQRLLELPESDGKSSFINEIAWREFSYHLIAQFPDLSKQPLRKEFSEFPWSSNSFLLNKWKRGQTGIPIVDAGMRQLWTTGWMHNRVRMIVASFLVKHLLIDWREGANHFMDTLVDGDIAINSTNWQWIAGCGTDSAPYFRIFNPVLQSQKFDPNGQYIREYVPELRSCSDKEIHNPASDAIVDLQKGRLHALSAFEAFKNT